MNEEYKEFRIDVSIRNDNVSGTLYVDGEAGDTIEADNVKELKREIDNYWKKGNGAIKRSAAYYVNGYSENYKYEEVTVTSYNRMDKSYFCTTKSKNRFKVNEFELTSLVVKNKTNEKILKEISVLHKEAKKLATTIEKTKRTLIKFKEGQ